MKMPRRRTLAKIAIVVMVLVVAVAGAGGWYYSNVLKSGSLVVRR